MTVTSIHETVLSRPCKTSRFDKWLKERVLDRLALIPLGQIELRDGDQSYRLGSHPDPDSSPAVMIIHHGSAYRDIFLGGSIGAGEAYMAGSWSSPDLVSLIQVMAKNIDFLNQLDGVQFLLSHIAGKFYHWTKRNTVKQAKKNIAAHYDLSNDFFALFLDSHMMYSAAVFPETHTSLEDASVQKLDMICRKLVLQKTDHLLEIGTGWGGLAVFAAKKYGCRVTSVTISDAQYRYARQVVKTQQLEHLVDIRLCDYREIQGQYDKLVSVEMIEAVGHRYYREFFHKCSQCLKPDGLMLLQAITIPDQRYARALESVDFIQRYIFPGGSLPCNHIISRSIARFTQLQIVGLQEIGDGYAETLRCWRERFMTCTDRVRQLGFNDSFIRLWEFYMAYCEGGFRERAIGTAQYLLAAPQWRPAAVV